MTPWIAAGTALSVLLAVTLLAVLRGSSLDRLIGLQLLGVLLPMTFVVVAAASGRDIYLDVAVVVAVLGFAGGLAYAHVLERWL